jgi:small-conductance mechanosensitive channel
MMSIVERRIPLSVGAEQSPDVNVSALSASSIDIELDVYVDDIVGDYYERRDDVRTDILGEVVVQFARAGISIPYNQLDVTVKSSSAAS